MKKKDNSIFIKRIHEEMLYWFGFDVNVVHIHKWLAKNPGDVFDTLERDTFANDLSREKIGMDYPCNGDSQEYKDKFWSTLDAKLATEKKL